MAKIKSRICKNLREFLKIQRKYIKYLCLKRYRKLWYIWLSVDLLYPWDKKLVRYASSLKEKGYPNLSLILQEIEDHYGWEYNDPGYPEDPRFKLVGIEITNEDYYYLYMNSSGDRTCMTCVGGYDEIGHLGNKEQ